ncbi:MAG: PD40 domain-containing protein [Bryobacterales bacterium]|nr:PD40 domain-containing protein [Bryobacterales bacterium]
MNVSAQSDCEHRFSFGAFELSVRRRELRWQTDLVALTGKPFDTLVCLLENRDRIVTREDLIQRVWKRTHVSDNAIDRVLTELRAALNRHDAGTMWIRTVYGEGYRFIGDVTESVDQSTRVNLPVPAASAVDGQQTPSPGTQLVREDTSWSRRRLTRAVLVIGTPALLAAGGLGIWAVRDPAKRLEFASPSSQITHSVRSKVSPVLTDGQHLFFTEIEGGRYRLSQVPVDGGETKEISVPFANPYACDISPDRKFLLVRDVTGAFDEYGPLWIVPVGGPAMPRKVGDLTAFDGNWSPDGTQIAAARGFQVYLISSNRLTVDRTIDLPGYGWWPRWSRDGRRLRLTVMDSKTLANSIWELDVRSGRLWRLAIAGPDLVNISAGSWTPDGRYFVFQSLFDGVYSVWGIAEPASARGNNPVLLTRGPMSWRGPAFTPVGRQLYLRGQLTKFEVLSYTPAGGRYHRFLSGLSAETVSFSRDHSQIAYTAMPGMGLWRCKSDGTERKRLLAPPLQAAQPRWSPDGSRIAVMLRRPGESWKIHLVSAEDGGIEELVPGGSKEATPDWSPDGTRIVFGRIFSVEDPEKILLHVADLRSKQVTAIPGSLRLFSPAWSPDGQYIAAIHSETFNLHVFDTRKNSWREVTRSRAGFPTWTQDSRAVVFLDPSTPYPSVYSAEISTGLVTKLADLTEVRPPNSSFGRWIGLHPDGSVLAVHDVSTDQIFAFDYVVR